MAKVEFDKDFLELGDKIKAIEDRAPNRIYEGYDRLGNAIRRDLRSASPEGPTGNLKRSWRQEKTIKEYGTYVTKVRSKAPHYHLVERGHRKVVRRRLKGGGSQKVQIGYVPGLKFAETVLDQWEVEIDRKNLAMIDEIMGDLFG